MPNIAAVLKVEITRLARKDVKQQIGPLKTTIAEQRWAIAALKREVVALERSRSFLNRQEKKRLAKTQKVADAEGVRFSPKCVAADRERLGLSAGTTGCLSAYPC